MFKSIRWEDLPEKLRNYLMNVLDEKIIPSVMSNQPLMKTILEGDFLSNLRNVIGMQFYYQIGLNIDYILKEHLLSRLMTTFEHKK